MRVAFCGFMGAGKTRLLNASSLGAPEKVKFYDLDLLIESETQMSIGKYVQKQDGWDKFRQLEAETLRRVVNDHRYLVLALGGGALEQAESRELLKQYGFILLYLDVDFKACFERIKGSQERPLIKQLSPEQLRTLYLDRQASYRIAHSLSSEEIDRIDCWSKFLSCMIAKGIIIKDQLSEDGLWQKA